MWVHAWIVILCKHLSDGGWYSHYLILVLKKKCQNHGQNLHSSCKVNFRFEPKIDLLPNDLMIHHENWRRRVSGSIHLLFKPFLDVLLDYYDMNVWRIPKQILDGKVEYHNIILFFRRLNFSQILAMRISNTYTQWRQTVLKIVSAQIWGGANLRPEFSCNFRDRTLLFLLGNFWAQSSPCDGRKKNWQCTCTGCTAQFGALAFTRFL